MKFDFFPVIMNASKLAMALKETVGMFNYGRDGSFNCLSDMYEVLHTCCQEIAEAENNKKDRWGTSAFTIDYDRISDTELYINIMCSIGSAVVPATACDDISFCDDLTDIAQYINIIQLQTGLGFYDIKRYPLYYLGELCKEALEEVERNDDNFGAGRNGDIYLEVWFDDENSCAELDVFLSLCGRTLVAE